MIDGIPLENQSSSNSPTSSLDTEPLLKNRQNLKQYTFSNLNTTTPANNNGPSTGGTLPRSPSNNAHQSYQDQLGKRQLKRYEKICYGLGEGGLSVYQVIKGFFLNEFLLGVARLNPFWAGAILFTTKFVDAFSDIFVGTLSDKTKSRWGRRRAWILFGALPLSILYCALWYVPQVSNTWKVVYYQVVVILLSVTYTCVAIPYSAMNAEITDDYDERTSLAGIRMISLMVGGLISSFVHSILIGVFTKQVGNQEVTDSEKGYLLSGGVWGFAMMIPLAITFFGTRNIPHDSKTESHIPFFKGLVVMIKNRAFICVTLLYFFCQIAVQFVQNNLLLYATYVAGAKDEFSYILGTLQISVAVFIFFWGKISQYIGKKTVYYIGGVFLLASFVSLYFLPQNKKYWLWGVSAFGGIGVSVAFLTPMSMLPDVVELDELKTGERREGIFYSLFLFFQKLGLSVGLAVSNFVLGVAGYEAPSVVSEDGISTEYIDSNYEKESVSNALRILVGVVPSVIVVFSFIAVILYPITKESHNETRELLRRKREGAIITLDYQ